ncbi:MAG: sigma 54-interacting transcriptional regulator [Clostridiales Family XIII bacterium]|jgi:transcriptional regulator with PAS, ATPase and Fis domain|nr:sigma 54-interacting transcriptional regulator [Clostridiales Family XIII bacterium]
MKAGAEMKRSAFLKLTDAELTAARRQAKKLVVYGGSILSPLAGHDSSGEYGILLFDLNGNLIAIHGKGKFLEWAEECGIEEGTRWNDESLGPNVVSLGMASDGTVMLAGDEHENAAFSTGVFAYTPINLEESGCIGGLVVAAPIKYNNRGLMMIAITAARAIELQYFWFDMLYRLDSPQEGNGLLVLDQSTGKNNILVVNSEVITILGIEQKDYFYKKLDSVIPRFPENNEFWELIDEAQLAHDRKIVLKIDDKEIVINVSSFPYNEKKFHMQGIIMYFTSLKRINRLIRKYSDTSAKFNFDDIIGEDSIMKAALQRAKMFAYTDSNILIEGESGVGKEMFAQSIHNNSSRWNRPFIAINCATFSKELITSELFGYEGGSYTGAKKEGGMGKFDMANHGTLFLDEISDIPLDLQAILLRVIEERSFRRVGGNDLIHVDVRIIAATNRRLNEQIAHKLFREDLYYRVGALKLSVPPLRERGEDILKIAERFSEQICTRLDKPVAFFSKAAVEFMLRYPWYGNVRELRNTLEGVLSLNNSPVITETMLMEFFTDAPVSSMIGGVLPLKPESVQQPYDDRYYERDEIESILHRFHGNKSRAAKYMGISRGTLYRWMNKYELT